MENNPINIHAIGTGERGIRTLDYFFKKFCDSRCVMVGGEQAEVFMLNLDAAGSEKQLKALQANSPLKPIIVMSLYEQKLEPDYFVRKPLVAKHLLAVLSEIEKLPNRQLEVENLDNILQHADDGSSHEQQTQIDSISSTLRTAKKVGRKEELAHFVGDNENIDLTDDASDKAKIYFNPKRYYLGHIQEAIQLAMEKNCSIKLTGRSHSVILCPNHALVSIDLSDNKLRYYGVTALYEGEMELKNSSKFSYRFLSDSEALDHFKNTPNIVQPLCPFMWKLSLWTSRGRLPSTLPLNRSLSIRNWPNLTRLVEIPHALQIIAGWLPEAKTVIELSKDLRIEQRYLFSIITATYIIGLSKLTDDAEAPNALRKNKTGTVPRKKSLFSRIIRKLRY